MAILFKMVKCMLRQFILFFMCGLLYYSAEILWRGFSHVSMFILAGICGVLFVDTPNNIYSFNLGYLKQVGISVFLCTIAEGICGLIVNVLLNLNVWDYSNMIGTFFFGQCNIFFVGLWALIIGLIGIPLCDAINYYWFNIEPCPYYKFNGKVFFKFSEREK